MAGFGCSPRTADEKGRRPTVRQRLVGTRAEFPDAIRPYLWPTNFSDEANFRPDVVTAKWIGAVPLRTSRRTFVNHVTSERKLCNHDSGFDVYRLHGKLGPQPYLPLLHRWPGTLRGCCCLSPTATWRD